MLLNSSTTESAAAIGTVVAHANPDDHAWGVPAVVADPSNGTLYMAADFAREKGENNQSVFWKSTDAGTTWTRMGSDASIGALALYVSGGSVSGDFQPMNINFGIISPLGYRVKGKRNKNAEISRRALEIIDRLKEENV